MAEGFALEKEWDLVEVVAKRTIEGEGGISGGIEDAENSSKKKFLPTNAWAWKAMGVVELVSSLAAALRNNLFEPLPLRSAGTTVNPSRISKLR